LLRDYRNLAYIRYNLKKKRRQMRYILVFLLLGFELFAGVIRSQIIEVDNEANVAKIKVEKIDVGVSGYIVHHITDQHSSILKNCVVTDFDAVSGIATLSMRDFNLLNTNALPQGRWKVQVGDTAELAFGYTRSLLIAPSEEIYYQITKSIKTQWVHPDLFATLLSIHGHPTPLQEDFKDLGVAASVGLVFIYLDKKLYTVDIKSFKILRIDDTPLTQDSVKLPFYSRVEKIDANWFGDGSDELEVYEPHYYKLLVKNNKTNKALYEIVKQHKNKEVSSLADQFEMGE